MASNSPQRAGVFNWIVGKYGDLIPLLAFLAVMAGVYVYDRQSREQIEAQEHSRETLMRRRATYVAEQIGSAINQRVGAMAAAELQFTPVEDSVSTGTFAAALDTVINRYPGLSAFSAVYPSGNVRRGAGALIGTDAMRLDRDTVLRNAYRRAQMTREIRPAERR